MKRFTRDSFTSLVWVIPTSITNVLFHLINRSETSTSGNRNLLWWFRQRIVRTPGALPLLGLNYSFNVVDSCPADSPLSRLSSRVLNSSFCEHTINTFCTGDRSASSLGCVGLMSSTLTPHHRHTERVSGRSKSKKHTHELLETSSLCRSIFIPGPLKGDGGKDSDY